MDAFSYLSVLLSIILGLALTQVLQGYRGLLLSRARVRLYPPPLIWSVLLLLMVIQNWWASFGLADHPEWTFAMFATIIVHTVLIYMMAALVLPDIAAADEPIDLRAHYYREAGPLFGLSLGVIGVSLFKEYMLEGRLPDPANLAFHLVFAAAALTVMVSRRPLLHEIFAPLMAVIFGAYIALLFAEL